ncbi:YTH domain-containing protein ECT2-like isoform X2 [Wolffia australiana]
MATLNPAAEQAADLVQKLSLETQAKSHTIPEVTKKTNGTAERNTLTNTNVPSNERSTTPILQDFVDPSLYYLSSGYASQPYYFGTYNNKWEDYSRYANPDEGVYGDYYPGYGYAPYGAFAPGSPVPAAGPDGQIYGHQQYQYPGLYYVPPTPTSSALTSTTQPPSSQAEVPTSTTASEEAATPLDSTKTTTKVSANDVVPAKHNHQKPLTGFNGQRGSAAVPGGIPAGYPPDLRYAYDGMRSPIQWLDGPTYLDGQHRHASNSTLSSVGLNSQRPGIMSRMYPNSRIYGQYGGAYRAGFASTGYDSRVNGHGWYAVDPKYKPRGRGGFFSPASESNELGELNRGPRSGQLKTQKPAVSTKTQTASGTAPAETEEESALLPEKELYNKADFPDDYPDAKFFVIKSYSEDDVHKSIKYGVWASTVNGNKKLHSAYVESKEKPGGCPVFLLFSVNTSGQFVGVAEMVGPVDFNKTVDYWQQDRWTGCFPVTWHIVKDVPNSVLKHIILENNDNKPVTNSRDTQEIKLEQGLQMLKLFKEHVSKTSILDDFLFYEVRQKTMQERRAKQQQFLKQVSARSNSVEEKGVDDAEKKAATDKTETAAINGGDEQKAGEKKVNANGVVSSC